MSRRKEPLPVIPRGASASNASIESTFHQFCRTSPREPLFLFRQLPDQFPQNRSQTRPQKLSRGGSLLAPFGKKTGTIARHRFAIHNKKAAMPFDITACACVVELNGIEPMAHAHSSNSSGSRSNMGTFSSPESQLALFAMKIWPSGLIGTSLSRLPAGTTRSAPSI